MIRPIAWLVYINIETRHIEQVMSCPGANIPADGQELDGRRVYRIYKDQLSDLNFKDPAQFMYAYEHNGNNWVYRGSDRPSEYYDWSGTAWVVNTESLLYDVRKIRNMKLGMSDWTQGADSPLSNEKKAEWVTYRQALRDIVDNLPADLDNPENVSWPTEPS